jgi:metal-responsive CopG/Arc/MetJ family transcriptional regulator
MPGIYWLTHTTNKFNTCHTVIYCMPPKGYTAVTLPKEVVKEIDDHAERIGVESRVEAIRSLLHTDDIQEDTEEIKETLAEVKNIISMMGDPGVVIEDDTIADLNSRLSEVEEKVE